MTELIRCKRNLTLLGSSYFNLHIITDVGRKWQSFNKKEISNFLENPSPVLIYPLWGRNRLWNNGSTDQFAVGRRACCNGFPSFGLAGLAECLLLFSRSSIAGMVLWQEPWLLSVEIRPAQSIVRKLFVSCLSQRNSTFWESISISLSIMWYVKRFAILTLSGPSHNNVSRALFTINDSIFMIPASTQSAAGASFWIWYLHSIGEH